MRNLSDECETVNCIHLLKTDFFCLFFGPETSPKCKGKQNGGHRDNFKIKNVPGGIARGVKLLEFSYIAVNFFSFFNQSHFPNGQSPLFYLPVKTSGTVTLIFVAILTKWYAMYRDVDCQF